MENKRNQLFVFEVLLEFLQRMHLEDFWGKTLETIFQCVRHGPYDLWAITRNQEGFIVKSLILMKNHFFRLPFCKLAASFSTPFILLRYCYLLCARRHTGGRKAPKMTPINLYNFHQLSSVLCEKPCSDVLLPNLDLRKNVFKRGLLVLKTTSCSDMNIKLLSQIRC